MTDRSPSVRPSTPAGFLRRGCGLQQGRHHRPDGWRCRHSNRDRHHPGDAQEEAVHLHPPRSHRGEKQLTCVFVSVCRVQAVLYGSQSGVGVWCCAHACTCECKLFFSIAQYICMYMSSFSLKKSLIYRTGLVHSKKKKFFSLYLLTKYNWINTRYQLISCFPFSNYPHLSFQNFH